MPEEFKLFGDEKLHLAHLRGHCDKATCTHYHKENSIMSDLTNTCPWPAPNQVQVLRQTYHELCAVREMIAAKYYVLAELFGWSDPWTREADYQLEAVRRVEHTTWCELMDTSHKQSLARRAEHEAEMAEIRNQYNQR